jgi:hypothetical protein
VLITGADAEHRQASWPATTGQPDHVEEIDATLAFEDQVSQ